MFQYLLGVGEGLKVFILEMTKRLLLSNKREKQWKVGPRNRFLQEHRAGKE